MEATCEVKVLDTYLGFDIHEREFRDDAGAPHLGLVARRAGVPIGELRTAQGEVLVALSMPEMRKAIWVWWHPQREVKGC